MNKKKNRLSDETGSGLVLAMMTLFVLTILGAAIMAVTLQGYHFTRVDGQGDAAFYVSEAGVNHAYAEVEVTVNSVYQSTDSEEQFFAQLDEHFRSISTTYEHFESNYGERPSATLTISEQSRNGSQREYRIVSNGRVGQRVRTLARDFTVHWTDPNPRNGGEELPVPNPPTGGANGFAAIVSQSVNVGGGTISGHLYFDSDGANAVRVNWGGQLGGNDDRIFFREGVNPGDVLWHPHKDNVGVQWQSTEEYDRLVDRSQNIAFEVPWDYYYGIVDNFPSVPDAQYPGDQVVENYINQHNIHRHQVMNNGSLYINSYVLQDVNYVLEMDQDMRFNEVVIGGHGPLRINTGGRSVNLVTDRLSITGSGGLEVIGDGEVNIYVTNQLNLADHSLGNPNNTTAVNLYYSGSEKVTIAGGFNMYASFFNQRADLEFGGGARVSGFIVSGGPRVQFSGGNASNTYLLAPRSEVNITGGGNMNGLMIARTLELQGGARLNYVDPSLTPPFTFAPHASSQAPNLDVVVDLLTAGAVYEVPDE